MQSTIARAFTLHGIGVHSGTPVSLTFHPGAPDSGIVFTQVHPDGSVVTIPAISANVGSTDFCTVLCQGETAAVGTVEHVMAALSGLEIDNVELEIMGSEVPILDGSAAAFIDAIDGAGRTIQNAPRRFLRVLKTVRAERGGSWAELTPHDGRRFEIDIDFDCTLIGRQSWHGDLDAETFRHELARARTFGFMRDVERLWASGHALGSSLENSLVISDDDTVINGDGLRFADEFARHKTVDAIGDLALAGGHLLGCYRSYRGGHRLNGMALQALLSDPTAYAVVGGDEADAIAVLG
ncbi:UDP-3-O-acyl-N-acetylglucosamine deacetylase [Pararhizobium mangrovi]|uniref:UDP-3-O-acyl-N-acetylglucosamine deacetylase n=1 Tax=Pararhizobium mangrovi TaxID=2590452 RepID=A0A506U8E1_9HYPH|nr:UDP-3-O-acyl-N-acetylglucosamine deacetylase [Pararhizobium mangrovi]